MQEHSQPQDHNEATPDHGLLSTALYVIFSSTIFAPLSIIFAILYISLIIIFLPLRILIYPVTLYVVSFFLLLVSLNEDIFTVIYGVYPQAPMIVAFILSFKLMAEEFIKIRDQQWFEIEEQLVLGKEIFFDALDIYAELFRSMKS